MSVVYIKRLSSTECNQLLDCTPLTQSSAITVKLVCLHSDLSYFWSESDNILRQVLNQMKKYFQFVCVQSCSYNYNVVYRITFLTSFPFSFGNVLSRIKNNTVSSLQFCFE